LLNLVVKIVLQHNPSNSGQTLAPQRNAALCHKPTYAAQQIAAYPVTSSAMASGVGGTVRPSIRAVLRIDHQLVLVRPLYGQVAWFCTAQLRGANLPYRLLYMPNQFWPVLSLVAGFDQGSSAFSICLFYGP